MKNMKTTMATIVGVAGVLGGMAGSSLAGPAGLSGPGEDHLFINHATPGMPELEHWTNTYTDDEDVSFNANWTDAVPSAWGGDIHVTGSRFAPNAAASGTQVLDFTGMTHGVLPAGTFFLFGDLDRQPFGEEFVFRAYDANNVQIEDAWLNGIVGVSGRGSGAGGIPVIGDMPSWSLNGGEYSFVGNSTVGNPAFGITLTSYMDISYLEVERPGNRSNSFALGAPVPTPGSASLLAIGGVLAARRRR